MLRYLLFLAFAILFFNVQAADKLSADSKVSVITASPGAELYSIFGHSAIRVKDDSLGIDWVYNYGTFDFDTPNFYLKFMRGKLNYFLSVAPYDRFIISYQYEGRALYEQELNLSLDQKQQIFDNLMENRKPENRFYKYDFFYDNCATRIRDIFVDTFGDSLVFTDEHVHQENSFRDLIDRYLMVMPWSDYGIDIALGLPTDKIAEPEDYMFLPDYIDTVFQNAALITPNGKIPFVKSRNQLLEKGELHIEKPAFTPNNINLIIFMIVIASTAVANVKKKRFRLVDYILFGLVGFIGWVVFVLWYFTDHIATKDNFNLLWAIPLYFPLIFFIFGEKFKTFRKYIFVFIIVSQLVVVSLWSVWPQNLHNTLIWIIFAVLTRSVYNLHFDNRKKSKKNKKSKKKKKSKSL